MRICFWFIVCATMANLLPATLLCTKSIHFTTRLQWLFHPFRDGRTLCSPMQSVAKTKEAADQRLTTNICERKAMSSQTPPTHPTPPPAHAQAADGGPPETQILCLFKQSAGSFFVLRRRRFNGTTAKRAGGHPGDGRRTHNDGQQRQTPTPMSMTSRHINDNTRNNNHM